MRQAIGIGNVKRPVFAGVGIRDLVRLRGGLRKTTISRSDSVYFLGRLTGKKAMSVCRTVDAIQGVTENPDVGKGASPAGVPRFCVPKKSGLCLPKTSSALRSMT